MIYSNIEFVVLFLVVLTLFVRFRRYTVRYGLILLASLLFYSWAGVFDTLIFLSVVIVSWVATWFARRYPRFRLFFFTAGISVLAAHLLLWKYVPWLVSEIQRWFPNFYGGLSLSLSLPIGISFFTLQGIAYMIDAYQNRVEHLSFKRYLIFKSFFSQLVAGPICRVPQLMPQLDKLSGPRGSDLNVGLGLFVLGFFKKLAIADTIAPTIDLVFASPELYDRPSLLLALLGYTVQIWADFSGYTDMGRGTARMLGITLPQNFLAPYFSKTPSEFWRRWHISLSQWIRDYLYIPLTQKFPRKAFFGAATIAMLLSGLWHGASWRFVLWGAYHGVLLWAYHQLSKTNWMNALKKKLPLTTQSGLLWSIFFPATVLGWLIFRSQSVTAIGTYLKTLFLGSGTLSAPSLTPLLLAFALCFFLQAANYYQDELKQRLLSFAPKREKLAHLCSAFAGGVLAVISFIALFVLSHAPGRAFIYFEF